MKRLPLTCAMIILAYCIGLAQFTTDKAYRDSLKNELFVANQDSVITQLLNALAESYWVSKYDSGIFYANNGLLIARKINYRQGEIQSLLTLSNVSSRIGDFVKGYEYSSMAIDLAKEMRNERLLAKAYTAFGEVFASAGKYNEGVMAIRKAVELETNDEFQLMLNYSQLSSWYESLNRSDSSDFYAAKAFNLMRKQSLDAPYPLRVAANMYSRMGNNDEALKYYNQSIQFSKELEDKVNLAMAYFDLSKYYDAVMEKDSTLFYASKMLESAEESRSIILIIQASNYLADLYRSIDKGKALTYAMKSNSTKDSLNQIVQEQSIQSFNNFDLQLQELEIQQAEQQLSTKLKQNTFIASIIILSVITFALYRNTRIKQKGKKKVENAYNKLKQTQEKLIYAEKMASLGELTAGIAHEIQNPLNFVNNFSDLNRELLDEVKDAAAQGNKEELDELIEDLKTNEERVLHHGKRAEEIVKSMLLHSRNGKGEKELTDINSLVDECLTLSYHGIRAKDMGFKSNFELDLDPDLPKTNAIRQDIGRVILNLVNNAFHAVKGAENPKVTVSTESDGDYITIAINDNGYGISEEIQDKIFQPFFTTKATGEGTGLGLSLSYDIINKGHGGDILINSKKGIGSTFSVKLPIS